MGEQRIDLSLITNQRAKELEAEINEMDRMLKADRASGRPKIQDEKEFRGQVAKKKKELEDFAPKKLTGRKANEAYATVKRLEKYIQKRMPSSKEYFQRYPKGTDAHSKHTDFEKAVQQQMAFQTNPRMQKACAIIKNLKARLDPDDPTVRNIEMLRK